MDTKTDIAPSVGAISGKNIHRVLFFSSSVCRILT
jgi:hypothetical protein